MARFLMALFLAKLPLLTNNQGMQSVMTLLQKPGYGKIGFTL
jgi:hypothetical protein